MEPKKFIYIGVAIFGTLGGFTPTLWGDNPFSFTSWLLGAVGAVVGIWVGYQVSRRL